MRLQTIQYPTQPALSPAYVMRARLNSGRISFPVKPSQAIYARFKHVQGFPSSKGNGISLSRLRSIDNLIDRLVNLKETSNNSAQRMKLETTIQSLEAAKSTISEGELSSIVKDGAEALHTVSTSPSPYSSAGGFQGILFNLSA